MAPELDLTQVPQERRYEMLARALQMLPPNGEIIVLTQGAARPLLQRLIAEHWGRFDWTPLAEQGGCWRSALRKRDAPLQSLTEFLSADHERIDGLYSRMLSMVQAGRDARAEFRLFETAMRRHIAMEEEGFFPEFDRMMGLEGQGPTAVMREEHVEIRELLDRMSGCAAEGDRAGLLAAGDTFVTLIEQHNLKEQQMLYPMADEAFGAQTDDLLRKLALY